MRLLFVFFILAACPLSNAQRLSEHIASLNSPYDERNPVLSPDGNTLYFTVAAHPKNIDGLRDPGDIWFSRRLESGWSAPVHGGPGLNNRSYNAVAGFSPDGQQLYLHGHYTGSAAPARTQGIAVARWSESGWSRPENIDIPYFLNRSDIISGALSADNRVFVFSAESYGTYGVEDLYVSIREGNQWSEPRNLGSTINTQFQELSPSLSDDMQTLYFSSNGRQGNGSFDIYKATRLDDSWMNWSAPENLGPEINTPGRDLFYRPIGDTGIALYTTTTSSEGYGDVRIFPPRESDPLIFADTSAFAAASREVPQEVSPEVVNNESPAAENQFRIYGKISDVRSGQVIPAHISFEGPDSQVHPAVADDDGYALTLPIDNYTIRIEARGYVSSLEKLEGDILDIRELEMNFALQPVEIGTTVNLKNVLFAQSKTDILPESFAELDLVVSFMKENPNVSIELMGHTDGRGVRAANVRLSQQRVDRVKEYLVSKGIDSRRITGKGYGGTRPVASNDTEESRRLNRRVEFVIKRL